MSRARPPAFQKHITFGFESEDSVGTRPLSRLTMSRRVGQPSVVFPPNTIFLDFPRSDGDETKRPTNTTRVIDSDGHVNFMQLLDVEQNGQAKKWRAVVGKAIATKLEMAGDPSNYVLRNWPDGYRLYDHHKGPADNPRHDLYLFGCGRSSRFRSINEFIPHAIWLFSDASMNYANCECKYCTRQPQKSITASMSNILGTPSSVSPSSRVRRERPPREKARGNRPYAAVQKVLKQAKVLKPSAHVLETPTLAERTSDVRAVRCRTSMKLKRWYRDGETVWCALDQSIAGPTGEDSNIEFWPGLVREHKLKAVAIPREDDSGTNAEQNASNFTSRSSNQLPVASTSSQPITNGDSTEDGRGTIYEKEDQTPFKVQQSTVYLVELFAVNKSIHIHDDHVIPYQTYIPPNNLIAALQAVPTDLLDFDRESVSRFNPWLNAPPPTFVEAAASYAVALQIASNLSQLFSVTDEWEFSYTPSVQTVPTPGPAPGPSLPPVSQPIGPPLDGTLESVISAAHRMNAATHSDINNIPFTQPFNNISGTQPETTQPDSNKLVDDIFAMSDSTATVRTQLRFQGLWWGPERIWVDDFVRLKVPRRSLAPNGAPNILPPAGPSKKALEAYADSGRDPSEIGAGARGVFMRIDSLFVVETLAKDGRKKKECRAGGILFELVDEDWEGDDTTSQQPAQPNGENMSSQRPVRPLPARATTSGQPPTVSSLTSSQPSAAPPSPAALSRKTPSKVSSSPYLDPQPPIGYKFRPILTPGFEAVVSLSLISGRYYPTLLLHPLLVKQTRKILQKPVAEGAFMQYGHLWAIEGLYPGYHCSVDPDTFQQSRTKMLEKADREAYAQLEAHKQYKLNMTIDEDIDMLQDDEDGRVREGSMMVD